MRMSTLRDRVGGRSYDAVIVGAGPNGLAAALTLARAQRSVLVLEAADTVGGGTRTLELTLPGFRHDICSAIHPLGVGSPFFRTVPLMEQGVEWIQPPLAVAHPLDDGTAGVVAQSLDETARALGPDGGAWRRLFGPLAARWDSLAPDLLGPVLHVPRHPLMLAAFVLRAAWPAAMLARTLFHTQPARVLFACRAPRSSLRARRAAGLLRSHARAGRQAHAVGLLPRPEWIDGGHRGSHPRADRALRSGTARAHPRRRGPRARRHRALQRELHRRRHRGRRQRHGSDDRPAGLAARSLRHARTRPLPLLVVHASGRRRPRDVRVPGRAVRAARSLAYSVTA